MSKVYPFSLSPSSSSSQSQRRTSGASLSTPGSSRSAASSPRPPLTSSSSGGGGAGVAGSGGSLGGEGEARSRSADLFRGEADVRVFSEERPAGVVAPRAVSGSALGVLQGERVPVEPPPALDTVQGADYWACGRCSFHNTQLDYDYCQICGSRRGSVLSPEAEAHPEVAAAGALSPTASLHELDVRVQVQPLMPSQTYASAPVVLEEGDSEEEEEEEVSAAGVSSQPLVISHGGMIRELKIVDQWSPVFFPSINEFKTPTAICGYVTAALAPLVADLFPYIMTESELQAMVRFLRNEAVVTSQVRRVMDYVNRDREQYVKAHKKGFASEQHRDAYMRDWVANYEISDWLRLIGNPRAQFARQIERGSVQHKEAERLVEEEPFRHLHFFVDHAAPRPGSRLLDTLSQGQDDAAPSAGSESVPHARVSAIQLAATQQGSKSAQSSPMISPILSPLSPTISPSQVPVDTALAAGAGRAADPVLPPFELSPEKPSRSPRPLRDNLPDVSELPENVMEAPNDWAERRFRELVKRIRAKEARSSRKLSLPSALGPARADNNEDVLPPSVDELSVDPAVLESRRVVFIGDMMGHFVIIKPTLLIQEAEEEADEEQEEEEAEEAGPERGSVLGLPGLQRGRSHSSPNVGVHTRRKQHTTTLTSEELRKRRPVRALIVLNSTKAHSLHKPITEQLFRMWFDRQYAPPSFDEVPS